LLSTFAKLLVMLLEKGVGETTLLLSPSPTEYGLV